MKGSVARNTSRGSSHRVGGRHVALLVSLAIAATVAGCTGSGATPPIIYITQSPGPTATALATQTSAEPTASAAATPTPTPVGTFVLATPSPTPAPAACNASYLTVTIQATSGIYWQGGGGHQLATFVLKNTGSAACLLKAKGQPLLLNGDDSILILGPAAGSSSTLTIAAGGKVHADVQTGNLCDAPTIVAPVRVAFMMPGGTGLVVATPLSSSDTGGVPPCLGDPSVYSGSIDMQPWAA